MNLNMSSLLLRTDCPFRFPLVVWLVIALVVLCGYGARLSFVTLFPDASLSLHVPMTGQIDQVLIYYTWLPRVAMALLCGAGLSLAGVLMQQVLRNPLASPTTLGVELGAQLALMCATILCPTAMLFSKTLVAMCGGAIAMCLVFMLSWKRGLSPTLIILAGLVVNLFFGSVSGAFLLFFQEELNGLTVWGAGSLAQTSWQGVAYLAPALLIAVCLSVLFIRPLSLLDLDDISAQSLGASLKLLRFGGLALAVWITGCVVSTAGIIGFIGLAAPAIARSAGARTFASRLLWSTLIGALLLLLTDVLLELVGPTLGIFMPTGAMTALLGAPLLLWLVPTVRVSRQLPPNASTLSVKRHSHPTRLFALLLVALCFAIGAGCMAGQSAEGWTFWQSVAGHAVWEWRVPRVIAALTAGILLATAGTIIQRLSGNPMASPELLGVSGGCAIGVIVCYAIFPAMQMTGLFLAGFGSAILMLAILILLNRRSQYQQDRLLLTGMALTALLDPIRTLILAENDPSTQQILAWISGSTYFVSTSVALPALIFALVLLYITLRFQRWLDLLTLGSVTAGALGVPTPVARLVLLLLVALLTAVSTLLVGPLSFIGLLAPHMARMFGLVRAKDHLMGAVLCGGLLMVLADWVGRQWLFPQEIPAGLVASLLGGTYFMWSLRKQ